MKRSGRRARRTSPWLGLLALAACGGDGDPAGVDPGPPAVASVSVTPGEANLTWLGETVELSATPRDGAGNALTGRTVAWSSLNEAVALVDTSGEVTAVGNGQTSIRATVDGVIGDAALTVAQVASVLSISPGSVTFDAVGDTVTLLAEAEDQGGSSIEDPAVTWASSDAGVAEVDDAGLVTAVGQGSAQISASVDELEEEAGVSVDQVIVALVLDVERDSLEFLGDSVRLEAEGRDRLENPVSGAEFVWSSENPDVVTIDDQGWARAVANGTGRIAVSVEGFEADTVVVVRQRPVALAVAVEPGEASAGQPLGIPPEVHVIDAGGSPVTIDEETVVSASIASGGGDLTGTLTVQTQDGAVVFTDLVVEGSVGERVLAFTAPDLDGAASEPFQLGPGLPVAVTHGGGDGQVGLADTELADSLAVVVVDDWENGVPGVAVSWSVLSGEGSLSAAEGETGQEGFASVAYTLGRHAGEEAVQAGVPELTGSPVEFVLTATPNATISGVVSLSSANLTALSLDASGEDPLVGGGPTGTATTQSWERQDAPSGGPRPPGVAGRREVEFPGMSSFGAPDPPGASGSYQGPESVPGELIVTLRPDAVDAPSVRGMARAGMAEARRVSDRIRSVLGPLGTADEQVPASEAFDVAGVSPVTLAARIRIDGPGATEAVARRLRADPRVATVEPNWIIHRGHSSSVTSGRGGSPGSSRSEWSPSAIAAAADFPVSDPLYPWQAWHYAMIGLEEAWEITTGSPSVIVAVVDDGIRFDHPDIAGNLTADGYDFVSNDWDYDICGGGTIGRSGDGDGYDPDPTTPLDYGWDELNQCLTELRATGGHGLHVAGTIGAVGNDGLGGTGVNWNLSIRPIRVMDIRGAGTAWDVAEGIVYAAGLPADDGADGTVQASQAAHIINLSLVFLLDAPVLELAVQLAEEAGALLVAAAGNAGTSVPNYPAAYPEVVSVSAVTPWATLASYSSFGSTIELAAPGGEGSFGCDFAVISTTWNFQTDQANWACFQGTSMAAPHVSGVAALILSNEPGLSASQVRSRLRDWAVDLGDPGWDPAFGFGLVNARNSLTQSFVPDGNVHVVLFDAVSGEEVDRTPAALDGSFEFRELDDRDYLVFAGRDRNGDGVIGLPRRRWGGFGGSTDPSAVVIDGAGDYPASFTIGFPLEAEPNNTFQEANRLVLGGYVQGIIEDVGDVDAFRISIPASGTYTFETTPLQGACGFALEEDTILQLYDGEGVLMREEDSIDPGAFNRCSRITETLEPGDYFLAVWGKNGERRYGLRAREGG